MNQETLGWLAVSVLNEHFPHPDDCESWIDPEAPEMGTTGCVVNCGPCAALHGLDATERADLERLIRLTGYADTGWSWWDGEDDRLRWDVLEAYWDGHVSCGMSAGVLTGCRFEDEGDPA